MIAAGKRLHEPAWTSANRSLCHMHQIPIETAASDPTVSLPSRPEGRRGWRGLKPRLGIGSRLALGLAAVAAVILVGHGLATQTTREAVEAVRSMQSEHEP